MVEYNQCKFGRHCDCQVFPELHFIASLHILSDSRISTQASYNDHSPDSRFGLTVDSFSADTCMAVRARLPPGILAGSLQFQWWQTRGLNQVWQVPISTVTDDL